MDTGTLRRRTHTRSYDDVTAAFVRSTSETLGLPDSFARLLSSDQKEALLSRRENFPNTTDGQAGLSCSTYLSYCAPSFSTVPLTVLISAFVIAFYEKIGADLSALAFFVALGGGLEVVMDPAMSYQTDSCRTRMGRRRPFLMLGCLPYAVSFVLLLTPGGPGIGTLTPSEASAWFGGFYMLFKCANSFTNIPYDALAPEVTDHPPSRSKLFFFCTIFDGVGSLCAAALPIGLQGIVTMYRTPDYDSCDRPDVANVIDLDSCSNYHSESREAMNWTMVRSANFYSWADNSSFCNDVDNKDGTYGAPDVGAEFLYQDMQSYCNCRSFCLSANTLDNTRGSYFTVGMFFGSWYIITMLACVCNIKERCQAGMDGDSPVDPLPKPAPLMPSSLKTFRNKPFTLLLPAWVCDALVAALISSLLTYFIRYIVEPEYAETGEAIGCLEGRNTAKWQCQSDIVLGFSILSVLFAAVIGSPMWLFLASPTRLGKRNTWLLWSLVMALTNPLYLFVGKGDVYKVILISFINGLPFGAKFLSDAILADVIDYDEFLTGSRSEATYTMFKSFLPKMAAIPAAAIPTALLNLFGHIAPIDGVYQKQTSASLLLYIKAVVIIIPSCLSFIAFLFKIRFPLRTTDQNILISTGIGQHGKAQEWMDKQKQEIESWGTIAHAPYEDIKHWYNSKSHDKRRDELKDKCKEMPKTEAEWDAREKEKWDEVVELFWSDPRHFLPPHLQPLDPISYVHYNLIQFSDTEKEQSTHDTASEMDMVNLMDNFPGVATSSKFRTGVETAGKKLVSQAWCQLLLVLLLLAGSCAGVAITGNMLFPEEVEDGGDEQKDSSDLSFIPVLFIVVVGVSVTMSIASCLRLCAARSIAKRPPSANVIEKIHMAREQLELAEDIDTSFCAGMRRSKIAQEGVEHRLEQAKEKAKDANYYMPSAHNLMNTGGGASSIDEVTEKLKQAFAKYDTDGDGAITLEELQNAEITREMQSGFSEKELMSMIKGADRNGDDKIDFEEFARLMLRDVEETRAEGGAGEEMAPLVGRSLADGNPKRNAKDGPPYAV